MNDDRRAGRRVERGWHSAASPFHAGEQRVQTLLGVRDHVERAGRNMIRDSMPDQHRALFEQLPLLVVASLDEAGRPWASFLAGEPGFVRSPSASELRVTTPALNGDPLRENLRLGAPLGVLGLQLETRRRNRANGHISALEAASFTLHVEQSFGNCKQYIQAREPHFGAELRARAGGVLRQGELLSERARELLLHTDTFFIATASPAASTSTGNEGVDVSHRGGRSGFVRVATDEGRSVVIFPDFSGNFMFNTLGNLVVNPRAGIALASFETGDVLSLTGVAKVIWEGAAVAAFPGAERLVMFAPEFGWLLEGALPLHFTGFEESPYLADTGTWSSVGIR